MTYLDILFAFDLAGVAVFALSGALAAARSRMDPFGFVVVGTVTGVGGGTLRDLVLGEGAVFWVTSPIYLGVAAAAAGLAWFIAPRLESRMTVLVWADALGLALFSVLGAAKAYGLEAHPAVVVIMGMISATFGGLLRDIICNDVPLVLKKEIYALAALAGAGVYLATELWIAPGLPALIAGAIVTFLIRAAAIRLNLSLPAYAGPSRKPPEDCR